MDTLKLKELLSEQKINILEMKPNSKYLIVFNENYVNTEWLNLYGTKIFPKGTIMLGVQGNPKEIISLYTLKDD